MNPNIPLPAAYRLSLALILSVGLYLRLAKLDGYIHFQGDQGEFYLAVMRWIHEGQWPLLGQHRSITGDYTIGPGWFYTIMPALTIGNFNPAAGVFVNTGFGLLAMMVAFTWMYRISQTAIAAIMITLVMATSAILIEQDRLLWSPYLFHFVTLAVALLISVFESHPTRYLSIYLMLCMILPHWHTTGWIICAVSSIFILRLVSLHRRKLGRSAWRGNRAWIILTVVWFLLLYVPPVLHELKPGDGNIGKYIVNTLMGAPPSEYSLWLRIKYITNITSYHVLHQAFNWRLENVDWPRFIITTLMTSSVILGWIQCRRRNIRVDFSICFMTTLFFTFMLVYIIRAEYFDDYYMMAVLLVPVHLTIWAGGIFLDGSGSGTTGGNLQRAIRIWGGILLAGMSLLSAMQWPAAWEIHRRDPAPYHETLEYVDTISEIAGEEPFSIALLENHQYRTHFHFLLKRLGREPLNGDFKRKTILKSEFGERAFIIIRGGSENYRRIVGQTDPALVTERRIGEGKLVVITRDKLNP